MPAISDPLPAPRLGEPYLLTPGPLTTAYSTKEAMLRDWGSWDADFRAMTKSLCDQLVALAGGSGGDFVCVPMQGSGSFSVEAMLGTFVPRDGKVLVLANGAYGLRAAETMRYLGRAYTLIDKGDYMPPRGDEVGAALDADPAITHVIAIHCETSSGILNPVAEISEAVYARGRKLLIDSMSAFGAIDLDVNRIRYEAMVSSANKCIEGVPGFGFVIARKSELEAAQGNAHSLSLDIHDQWAHMEKTGQWRFTPPTHVVAAFIEALRLHRLEGGVDGRGARYQANCETMVEGMRALGFETLLPDRLQAPIIVTFLMPVDPKFHFQTFYDRLRERGFVIYPGKLTVADTFRIGCIGRLGRPEMEGALAAIKAVLAELGVTRCAPKAAA